MTCFLMCDCKNAILQLYRNLYRDLYYDSYQNSGINTILEFFFASKEIDTIKTSHKKQFHLQNGTYCAFQMALHHLRDIP